MTSFAVTAADLHTQAGYCAAESHAYDKLGNQIWPSWDEPENHVTKKQSLDPLTVSLDKVGHNLNSGYLQEMVGPMYMRLAAAKAAGLEIEAYQRALNLVAESCARPDRSGQSLRSESLRLSRVIEEVNQDFAQQKLSFSPDDSLRRLAVAALEANRIEHVLLSLPAQLETAKKTGNLVRVENISNVMRAYVRRGLRLQYRYPALLSVGALTGGTALQISVETALYPHTPPDPEELFFSDPKLEEKLGLNSMGTPPLDLPQVPGLEDQFGQLKTRHSFYAKLYDDILSGHRVLTPELKATLIVALNTSVHEAIQSAMLKCQNQTPCLALSVSKTAASEALESAENSDQLKAASCLCKIGEQHEIVNGWVNLGLGVLSAGAVVGVALVPGGGPAEMAVYLARILAFADSGAAYAGMYDSYANITRTNKLAYMRSGGAVSPIEELDTLNEYTYQRIATLYNAVTGYVGAKLPGDIQTRTPGISVAEKWRDQAFQSQAKLEGAKTVAGMPGPGVDGQAKADSDDLDPRRSLAPIPFELRVANPLLATRMDNAAQIYSTRDARSRDEIFVELKSDQRNWIQTARLKR